MSIYLLGLNIWWGKNIEFLSPGQSPLNAASPAAAAKVVDAKPVAAAHVVAECANSIVAESTVAADGGGVIVMAAVLAVKVVVTKLLPLYLLLDPNTTVAKSTEAS